MGISALDHRQGMLALAAPSTGATFGGRSGVFPGGTVGGGVSDDVAVTAASGMSVRVGGGQYGVDRGSAGYYLGSVNATVTVTHGAANASNPRIDYVVIRTRDPGIDSNVTESAKVIILAGSPAAVPPEPSGQLTSGDLLLAAVTVRANTTSIIASDISDRRIFISARGGVTPYNPALGAPTGAYEGQYFDNVATGGLERWTGTELIQVASSAGWTAFTPTLSSSAGVCNLGPGGIAVGAYQQLGKTLRVRYYFVAFRPCNLGYGPISTKLPPGYYAATGAAGTADQHGRCQLNTQPPGGVYQTWLGDSGVFTGSNVVLPMLPLNAGTPVLGQYQVAQQAGQPGTGIPLISNEYPDPLRGLGMSLELEVQ